ncbi:lipopolysaccharide biosynthesis protein [Acuticoccus yangtzensis]|uniref:lipopolysaccharide biosynthesis protein n=1 Tax=Acuticoccus yangtzensis TaxID=1443441 RepID=UPI0009498398|nr:lipopolysaccharide biosynthesis protein [Acuticoccus yangtzensis]
MGGGLDPNLAEPRPGTSLGRLAVRGGAAALCAQGLTIAVELATMAVLSRLLAPRDYGLAAMAASVVALVGLLRDAGLGTALVQRAEIDADTASGVFFTGVALAAGLTLVACAVAPAAAAAFGEPQVAPLVMVGAALFPVAALGTVHGALLSRQMRLASLNAASLAGLVLSSAAMIGLAAAGAGPFALLAGSFAGTLVQVALVWRLVPWRPSRVRRWDGVRGALSFGAPLTATSLVTYLNRQFDNVLIGWRWGPGELGLYSRAYSILTLPQSLVAGPISASVVPALARLKDAPERWRGLVEDALRVTFCLSFLVAALMVANGGDIIALLAGPGWERAADMVTIFGLSMAARTVMTANPWIFVSLGRTRRMLGLQCATLPAFLTGMVAGLPFGAEGVALGFSLAHALVAVPCVVVAARGSPIGAAAILRLAAPLLGVALGAVGLSRLLRVPAAAGEVWPCLLNLAATGILYAVGAGLVVLLDPAFGRLRGQMRDVAGALVRRGVAAAAVRRKAA